MGIGGLLPFLSAITRPVHIKDYAGSTVAVDGYVWLHRGAFACATELCTNKPTRVYINYCMKYVQLMRKNGVEPFLVFDGGYLPMKGGTERTRHLRKKELLSQANEELLKGNTTKATELFQCCVDVTPYMAFELIKVLKEANIRYVVAPYEADAQLAFLERTKQVSAVLTEDSDLLVFGCQRVILKLDFQGNAVEIKACDFGSVPSFKHGCDYLPSLKGVGLKKAFAAIAENRTGEKVIKNWKKWGKVINAPKVPQEYEEEFRKADLTFLHQRVYDQSSHELVYLYPLPPEYGFLACDDFLGPYLDSAIAKAIAEGEMDPILKIPFKAPDYEQRQKEFYEKTMADEKPILTESTKLPSNTTSHHPANRIPPMTSSIALKPHIPTLTATTSNFFAPSPFTSSTTSTPTTAKSAISLSAIKREDSGYETAQSTNQFFMKKEKRKVVEKENEVPLEARKRKLLGGLSTTELFSSFRFGGESVVTTDGVSKVSTRRALEEGDKNKDVKNVAKSGLQVGGKVDGLVEQNDNENVKMAAVGIASKHAASLSARFKLTSSAHQMI
ncbi:hypothetical protein HDU97_007744 [Phlyctochytrium planicorne]|nr:hypothetical protein HDU97_007744 [Phlyctochytrium planicorne]